jgi:hypothetical protein
VFHSYTLASSSRETFPTPSAGAYGGNLTSEEDVDVIEECLITIHKQEEIPEAITPSTEYG